MIEIDKQIKRAHAVYERWMQMQDDCSNHINVEVFMSHYLYQDLVLLQNESTTDLGAYIKVFLNYSQTEIARILERQNLN
ncbi:hypothetical protein SAMN05880501_105185 [Ureibacillus xyleni]|uniref:Uncharacterized protein n=1 Tax=Ureibacillus xyleni TaxID=614648 RepID=A0A285SM82_9BACL|nr:hypothetical protein [Ureibacillus xyleni]SOC09142.1 hypothetical protein SAMN05880501_105185 [Ureibacillus xyleni]